MIQNFNDREARKFFEGFRFRAFQDSEYHADHRLTILDNAASLRDLAALRSNKLESLSGIREGQFSIWVNRKWRICFRWGDEGPYAVEIVDYH